MDKSLKKKVLKIQKNEITEYYIYKKISVIIKYVKHKTIIDKIADEELIHYNYLKSLTNFNIGPNKIKIFFYFLITKFLGLNFGLKLMEGGEEIAQEVYDSIYSFSPEIDKILKDEKKHEIELLNLIEEEHLKYISSIVLGLNDALVELSGALVGFTLALQKTKLIGIVGLITGIAAAMSMSVSEFLSTKHEDDSFKSPFKASFYTGTAYIFTVIILVIPYFLFSNMFLCLGFVVFNVLLLIFLFTFYISVSKNLNFKQRFFEMATISIGVAVINFVIGLIIRNVFGIDV